MSDQVIVFGLTVEQILDLKKFYETQTGEPSREIGKDTADKIVRDLAKLAGFPAAYVEAMQLAKRALKITRDSK